MLNTTITCYAVPNTATTQEAESTDDVGEKAQYRFDHASQSKIHFFEHRGRT